MSNPILKSSFNPENRSFALEGKPMTVGGVMNKLGLLAVLMFISGGATWYQFVIGNLDKVYMLTMGGFIVGFVLAMITCFARKAAPFTTPLYAFAEGAALAGLSCILEAQFPGIVVKAVSMTFITLLAMYVLYAGRIIKVTEKLKSAIITVTFSILVFYIISWILALFHINIPMLYDSSPLSIGFSVFVCAVAAFNLLIDFDFIEQATRNFFPQEYEWLGAFGVATTLVWLYVEILNLLSKLNRR
ncbi:MAG: Bax inhibitor-1/YccA family protein [Candidatus Gastranaerophilales bacterium]|nr:Bax inhibitor-1/YccA family protein [Candidatus Gastranaerophilales bacterium]